MVTRAPAIPSLLEAAEELIGRFGVDGVSLRAIGRAANQRNNSAVQHHFKDLPGVVRAIQQWRMPHVENQRAALFSRLVEKNCTREPAGLIEVLYRPLVLDRADSTRHYARFVLALITCHNPERFPYDVRAASPTSAEVLDLLAELIPGVPKPIMLERQRFVAIMVLAGMIYGRAEQDEERRFRDLLAMAIAALTATFDAR